MADRTADTWNSRYETGDLPWDSGVADHSLLETLDMLKLPPGAALEIGCGTGTNAIALAQHGFAPVVATDVAPRAVELARAKAQVAGVNVAFHVHDFLSEASIPGVDPHSVEFVFDRGVLHSVTDEQRPAFAQRVASLLRPRGWWFTLCGNADDKTEGGPPRLTAAHLAAVLEPLFEIHTITRGRFRDIVDEHTTVYLNWRVLMHKRA